MFITLNPHSFLENPNIGKCFKMVPEVPRGWLMCLFGQKVAAAIILLWCFNSLSLAFLFPLTLIGSNNFVIFPRSHYCCSRLPKAVSQCLGPAEASIVLANTWYWEWLCLRWEYYLLSLAKPLTCQYHPSGDITHFISSGESKTAITTHLLLVLIPF